MTIQELLNKIFKKNTRSTNAVRNILYSFFIKGLNIALGLIMVPLTINYLTEYKYGIWLTLTSIVGWFYFFDVGLANGLRNKFAEAKANNEHELARKYLSTTYFFIILISLGILLLFLAINPFLNWIHILNCPSENEAEISLLMVFLVLSFCLQFVLRLIRTVLLADQRPAFGDLLDLIGKIASLLIIILLIKTTKNSLLYLGIGVSISPLVILLIATATFFNGRYKIYRPGLKYIEKKYIKDLFNLGIQFFIIQIAVLIMYSTDNVIISQLFGPAEVTPYNIAYKYFSIISMAFTIVFSPFWSAFTEAWVKKDVEWIRKTVKRLQLFWLIFLVIDIVMVISANFIYRIWVGKAIVVPFSLTVLMGFYVIINAFGDIYVNFINGVGKVKLQLYSAILAAALNIPLCIFFAKTLNMGIAGIILATTVCIFYGPLFAPIQYFKIINNKAKGIWNK